jgi:hypothetical protein
VQSGQDVKLKALYAESRVQEYLVLCFHSSTYLHGTLLQQKENNTFTFLLQKQIVATVGKEWKQPELAFFYQLRIRRILG